MLAIEAISKAIDSLPRSNSRSARDLARRLGWFSIALGAIQIAAPRRLTRFLGLRGSESTIAFFGLREIATGVAILSTRNPAPFVWARVAGDGLDIAALLAGFLSSRRKPAAGAALASVAVIAAIDLICAQTLSTDEAREYGRIPDYGNRTGLPKTAAQMRGVAAQDFKIPAGMRAASAQAGATMP